MIEMQLHRPLRVVTPTVDGDVLMVLARADTAFTPPQIHRILGVWSVDGVRRSLDRLVTQGLVRHQSAGRAGLYSLNRDHLAASAVMALAAQFDDFLRRLSHRFESWEVGAVFAALFGSAARGDMHDDSDIDLFVVRSDDVESDDERWRTQLEQLERDVALWTGNDARVVELSAHECRTAARRREPLLFDVRDQGIRLAGSATVPA